MGEGKFKSRTFRRKNVRTINGTKRRYDRRKPKLGTCSKTGEKLKGVPRVLPGKARTMSKSQKRPSRPFGGVLSSRASREEIKQRARAQNE